MLFDYYDDTKDLKLFIRIFHFFDCSNETRYFDSVKCILKQMHCRKCPNKKPKKSQIATAPFEILHARTETIQLLKTRVEKLISNYRKGWTLPPLIMTHVSTQ